jgi:hypothetical protein
VTVDPMTNPVRRGLSKAMNQLLVFGPGQNTMDGLVILILIGEH